MTAKDVPPQTTDRALDDALGALTRLKGLLAERTSAASQATVLAPRDDARSAARDDWELTFNAVSDPICVMTPDFRIVRANEAYIRLFGLPRDRTPEHVCYQDGYGRSSPCPDCPLPRTLATARPAHERQLRLVPGPNGVPERRLFDTGMYPVCDEGDAVVRIVEIIRDITEQEQLREAQHQASALRAADRFKAELLGTVSHELRSPLAAIKGYAATLRRHERRLSQQERREFLDAIDTSSDRLALIIDRLLEMSELETGRVALRPSQVDLARLVSAAISYAEERERADGGPRPTFALRIVTAEGLPSAGPMLMHADPHLLRDVVDNLLENAVKYSPESSLIEVVLRPAGATPAASAQILRHAAASERLASEDAPAGSGAAPRFVELIVRDAGIGIPEEHIDQIFETFHRVDTGLTREAGGLGLGLALCRRIIELHHGTIWAESTPGSGSAFHVLLPAASDAATLAERMEGDAGKEDEGGRGGR